MNRSPEELTALKAAYDRDGVICLRQFLTAAEVASIREELDRYSREDLPSKPKDAATLESDGVTIRNLWRLEQHNPRLRNLAERADILELAGCLVNGEPELAAIETFNKPAKVGSGVPSHQDNAYFCRTPPDMLTVWIAIDPVTEENGPVTYVKGSHRDGVLPTKPSGVKGNSIGLADPVTVPIEDQYRALLNPGDATIHHCNTIHHSAPNTTDHPRLGFLFVFRGRHTRVDDALRETYAAAAAANPPA